MAYTLYIGGTFVAYTLHTIGGTFIAYTLQYKGQTFMAYTLYRWNIYGIHTI